MKIDKELILTTAFISVILGIIIWIVSSYTPEKEYQNRELIKITKEDSLDLRLISLTNVNKIKDEYKNQKLPKKYIPICEREVINKFLTNKESLSCMKKYEIKLNKELTYNQVYKTRQDLLKCIKRVDDNLYTPMFYNLRGIDLPMYDVMVYNQFCKIHQDRIDEFFLYISYILLLCMILVLYLMTNKKILLVGIPIILLIAYYL